MAEKTTVDYSLKGKSEGGAVAAPDLPYRPRDPKHYRPKIGLIGCGGISASHLKAYQAAGYDVVALCDLNRDRAEKRRKEFYPEAKTYIDSAELLRRDDIEVVDIATHPKERVALIEAALNAGKHVLSQKPFVLDLDTGERLADLADQRGLRLAVNQNGRWAPHLSYLREAVRAGVIGDLISAHVGIHWDHSWIAGTPFEQIDDVILYDFAIHWFDFVATLLGERNATRIQASRNVVVGQNIAIPMVAQAIVEFDGGQASLVFDGHLKHGTEDRTYVGGTKGSLVSRGSNLGEQRVTVYMEEGIASPNLTGAWFNDGFHGTMGELLCAIEDGREPMNGARNNLNSLALCFAGIAAARDGASKIPGEVRRLP
jgi:predicted dehydrogenase